METFDYIVIGGGSSGCVVAARLASEGDAKVLLLEAGYSHRHYLLDMPPGIFKMINGSKFMKYHKTVPQDHLNGRVHEISQGNVLGGGSSVNAQVYMRGRPSDYDEWQEILRGNNDGLGWGWRDVLPHFRSMEANNRLHDEYHGIDGKMLVSDPGHINEMSRWFVQSVQAMGEPFNPDFNGINQRGTGFYQFMNRNGKRSSAAYAYIEPEKENPNLVVRLRCSVQKILIEKNRAKGVIYKNKSGELITVSAESEIILSAGALISPKVLMLSGIGCADQLKQHGVTCHADLPGVGQNLIDHPEVPITAFANGPYGYFRQGNGWRMIRNGLQLKLFGTGPITSAGVEAGAFINPSEPHSDPTIQAFCVPIVYLDRDVLDEVEDDYGVTVTTVVIKPKSRGEVRLASSNPDDMPLVSPNLLKHPADMTEMLEGQRFFVEALSKNPIASKLRSIVIPDINNLTDDALSAHCRRFVKTNYHPAGTVKMGADSDKMSVLNSRMQVRGIDSLRVCDMSVVPNINAGNTNAPAMMLGNRCADLLMENL